MTVACPMCGYEYLQMVPRCPECGEEHPQLPRNRLVQPDLKSGIGQLFACWILTTGSLMAYLGLELFFQWYAAFDLVHLINPVELCCFMVCVIPCFIWGRIEGFRGKTNLNNSSLSLQIFADLTLSKTLDVAVIALVPVGGKLSGLLFRDPGLVYAIVILIASCYALLDFLMLANFFLELHDRLNQKKLVRLTGFFKRVATVGSCLAVTWLVLFCILAEFNKILFPVLVGLLLLANLLYVMLLVRTYRILDAGPVITPLEEM